MKTVAASVTEPPAVTKLSDTWPSAFGAYKLSRGAVKRSLGTIVTLFVINILLTIYLLIMYSAVLATLYEYITHATKAESKVAAASV